MLHWHAAVTEAMAQATDRRLALLSFGTRKNDAIQVHGLGSVAAAEDFNSDFESEVAVLEARAAALQVVAEAQRGLLAFLVATIDDGAGIRFLGVFRPGAASVGGLLALVASAAALGIRLAASVYGATAGTV